MDIDYSLISENANILVVDDTTENLSLLSSLLKDCGFTVRPVPSGRLALMAARSEPPDLVLLDITMPEMDGYEVCRQMKADVRLNEIPVLFISALAQTDEKVKAFEAGGVDYITKPFQFDEVKARVETHLKLHRLQMDLERQVENQVTEISDLQMGMIFGLAKLAEARDNETGQHLDRIRILCRLFAEGLQTQPAFVKCIDETYTRRIYEASPLHDIGKVGIPDGILLKPDKLTPSEFEIMKTHTTIGSQTLEDVRLRFPTNEFLMMGIRIARSHHEKWNGQGYPDGLRGDEIPLCARIMAVVDVYDAVRSKRVYKPPYTHEEACKIIHAGRDEHFDPALVDVFESLNQRFVEVWRELQD